VRENARVEGRSELSAGRRASQVSLRWVHALVLHNFDEGGDKCVQTHSAGIACWRLGADLRTRAASAANCRRNDERSISARCASQIGHIDEDNAFNGVAVGITKKAGALILLRLVGRE
jgi:hypothetical protein